MSHVATIKAAIKTRLATVSGLDASTIHTRTRAPLGENDAAFRTLHVSGSRVNTWEIERESFASAWKATNKAWELLDSYTIKGWYGFDDAAATPSETTFADLVEDVVEALNADQSIGQVSAPRVLTHGTVQCRIYGHAQKGPYLCHYAELTLTLRWTHVGP